ncbi:MAG: malto-oligosyltrehalose synthase [Burkholderiaceae bacterium]|nr:malto-oligosyltrehalose synthase [Burkholderiaceae bacterium]
MAEGTPRQRLEWLALAYGVDPYYEDVWGRRHDVTDDGLRALLAQLDVDAGDDDQVERSLAQTHPRYWKRLAEPVVAIELPAAGIGLLLRVPRHAGETPTVEWRLAFEGGTTLAGSADIDALALRETTDVHGVRHEARRLEIDASPAPGYHRLSLQVGALHADVLVIAAPAHCFQPPAMRKGTRIWGWAVQLYGLRSTRNWGVGDFGDLLALVDVAASHGASAIGLNPLHARFAHNPAHASPYAPSSRLWLDVLSIDVQAVDGFDEAEDVRELVGSDAFRARLRTSRGCPLVDFPAVSALKHEVLRRLYSHFRRTQLATDTALAREFRAFQARAGRALRRHALFEALQEHFHSSDPSIWGWQVWPEEFRDIESEAVRHFESEAIESIEYHEYLQWHADRQLERAATHCRERGMAIGLYRDLAVSVDRAGSDSWSFARCYAMQASVGAPPDDFNLLGQDWGLPPFAPDALRARGHEPFVLALRSNMRHAGALRIDHVMALMRLYWVPPHAGARNGAYVHYPLDELLSIVALESHRNRCLVVGEDLGTVPPALREALARRRVLSYRLLYFERDAAGEFLRPGAYPHDALVSIGTHDLPTLPGWWVGHDLRVRAEMGLFPDEETRRAQTQARASDRSRLVAAMTAEGALPAGRDANGADVDRDADDVAAGPLTAGLVDAVHRYLAGTPSAMMMIQPEDWLGVVEQNNLPGTTDTHPNWRRRLPVDLDTLAHEPATGRLAGVLGALRESPRARRAAHPVQARIPRSTYRVQLQHAFAFDDALRALPYLDRLGVGDLYCSPVLTARPASTHGYDIVDHGRISAELGGSAGFEALSDALRERGMGLLCDVVPNHMGVLCAENEWWMDVLTHGEASAHARFFDIDWHPANVDLHGKVLVPLLGDHYGDVLERGELVLRFDPGRGRFAIGYHEHRLPIDPLTAATVLRIADRRLARDRAPSGTRAALAAVHQRFEQLPSRLPASEGAEGFRSEAGELCSGALAQLVATHARVRDAIDAAVESLNARTSSARESLHELIERQAWRVAYWRVASDEINYRRFFDIDALAGLRVEDEKVFEATHALVLDLATRGRIDGLRIDHSDGLYDPGAYFERLQRGFAERRGADLRPDNGRPARPLYVVIEKIVASHERVPERWAIHGTTGYRFAAICTGVFVDRKAKPRIDRIWRSFTGERAGFEETAYECKLLTMRHSLASELRVLAAELLRIARADRRTRDYSADTLRRALAEVAARLPVYRTYIVERPSKQDRRYVDWAVGQSARRSRAADPTVFGFVRNALLGRAPPGSPSALRQRTLRFARRFQQFTSPVAAKGVEDTALYRFNRLVSLNDVGTEPDTFGYSLEAFHGANLDRAAHWPHTMLALSTHDSKRSADVRARIDVLSWMPAGWRWMLRRWRRMNRSRRRTAHGTAAPSPNDEYLLYQVLLGTFRPENTSSQTHAEYIERIQRFVRKAAREAKVHTSWVNPDTDYEEALAGFVRAILESQAFVEDLREQVMPIAWFGALNSLAMLALQHTVPGVPDLYQGNECFDFSLVDPDNRRPVDFGRHAAMLEAIELRVAHEGVAAAAASLSRDPRADECKLFVAWRLLQLRRARPALFRDGDYVPLEVTGEHARHLIAYARQDSETVVVAVVARGLPGLIETGELPEAASWGDTRVSLAGIDAAGELVDELGGGSVQVSLGEFSPAQLLRGLPAAVLLGPAAG